MFFFPTNENTIDMKRRMQFESYNFARKSFINMPNLLIKLEKYADQLVNETIRKNYNEIKMDYDEASFLNPFWANYAPYDRGRDPKHDQVPWIEVGEHAIGHKLNRLIAKDSIVREIGLPVGADDRFVLISNKINEISEGITDKLFLFIDIKSVGPRDRQEHSVVSPYQISGDGIWNDINQNLKNSTIIENGVRVQHLFYPALAPIYVFSDGTIAPIVHLFVKPDYEMNGPNGSCSFGQFLDSITTVCVPNGLLLTQNPNYIKKYPKLFFPGKDDKKTDPQKRRTRVSFRDLKEIAAWRVQIFSEQL